MKVFSINVVRVIIALILAVTTMFFSATSIAKEVVKKSKIITELLNKTSGPTEPGVQYVVFDKNSTLFEGSVGLSDIKKNVPLSLNHTMAAFSMTKTLSAIAVLQLVEQNKINLDDVVSEYIQHPYRSEITIRQLLNHTSGIPNPIPLKWAHLAEKHSDFDESKALAEVLKKHSDLDAQPGTEYGYSNIGYWLLGKLIENVSGKSYTNYVTENIFKPLALSSDEVGFLISNNNHAKGYLKKWSFMNLLGRFFIDDNVLGDYEGRWLHIKNVYLNGPSFGGAIGTAEAFGKILQDLLSKQPKLLQPKSKQLLYTQQTTKSGKKIAMTLGWHMSQLDGEIYYYKEGGGAGFHSEMRIYPESGLASILMTNRTSFNSRKILSELDANFVEN